MKIMICGKSDIAIDVTRSLVSILGEDRLIQVFCESERSAVPPFRNFAEFALSSGVPWASVPAHNESHHFEGIVTDLQPDLIISCQFSVIIGRDTIDRSNGRILNLHFSPLPKYRGVAPILNAILNDEDLHGVTLHLIDRGIDTGPIIAQEVFQISGLTSYEVYRLCTEKGCALVVDNLNNIIDSYLKRGDVASIARAQDHSRARYFSKNRVDYSKNIISGDCTAHDVELLVRAYTFPPLTYPRIRLSSGESVPVREPQILYDRGLCDKSYGTVVAEGDTYLLATRDFWVRLYPV